MKKWTSSDELIVAASGEADEAMYGSLGDARECIVQARKSMRADWLGDAIYAFRDAAQTAGYAKGALLALDAMGEPARKRERSRLSKPLKDIDKLAADLAREI